MIEIVGADALSEDAANEVIMAARAHWFDDEEPASEPAAADEAGEQPAAGE